VSVRETEKRVIVTAGSGRSGTTSIVRLFNENVRDCVAEHEPPRPRGGTLGRALDLLSEGRAPRLEERGFRDALKWYDDDDPRIAVVVKKKAERIRRMECSVYLEGNNAFLKSLCDGYAEEFPSLAMIHLTRDPLEVARSGANREPGIDFKSWHPQPSFRKNVVRLEGAFLTPFQRHLWSWIEVELRFVRFIEKHPTLEFVEIDVRELNDRVKVADLFAQFGLPLVHEHVELLPAANTNRAPTVVDEKDHMEASELMKMIDVDLLDRLRRPYRLLELI